MVGKASSVLAVVAATAVTVNAEYSCAGLENRPKQEARCLAFKPLFDFIGYDPSTFSCDISGDPCANTESCISVTCSTDGDKVVTGIDISNLLSENKDKISFKTAFDDAEEQLPGVVSGLKSLGSLTSPIAFTGLSQSQYTALFKDICGTESNTVPVTSGDGVISVGPGIFDEINCNGCFSDQTEAIKNEYLDDAGNWGKNLDAAGCASLNSLTGSTATDAPTTSTDAPTTDTTDAPTTDTTDAPTTSDATDAPTVSPTIVTDAPTANGTVSPTVSPTMAPSSAATVATGIALSVIGLFLQF